ncbi:MAG: glutaredoxin family protein [Actinomycetota bacterium]
MAHRSPPQVILYSRPGCHLCENACAALDAAGVAYEEVDITTDAGLEAEYRYLIPVVEVAGQQVFEAGMNPADLGELVREAARQ